MKLEIWVCTKYIGSNVKELIDVEDDLGIDVEDWKEMDCFEKSEIVHEYIEDTQMYEWGFEEY